MSKEQQMPDLDALLENHQSFYEKGGTRSIALRILYLHRLKQALRKYEQEWFEALRQDLNKSDFESYVTELGMVLSEIGFISRKLTKWAKPKKVKTPLTHLGSTSLIIKEPYGTVLIISPWNYPLQLALSPLIGAIAAGNTVVLKPSELTPAVSALLAKLLGEVFPQDYVTVVEGGPEVSTALLERKFDYLFFTGSVKVGKIVMEAAAKQLTPVTLELGGKSPCIVHDDASIQLAARRIVFGKFTNAGQTCVAPDYVLVQRKVQDRLLAELQAAIIRFYGEDPLINPDYGRIVSERHFDRLYQFLQDGGIGFGGRSDRDKLRIEPTLLTDVHWGMPVMQEEIFGPLLPILVYDELQEAIDWVRRRPKPLALYLFTGSRKVQRAVTHELSFGGGTINDTLMHLATPYLPFGGVGESGMGSYHGYESFRTFTHEKSIVRQTTLFDLSFRYPYSKRGLSIIRKLMK